MDHYSDLAAHPEEQYRKLLRSAGMTDNLKSMPTGENEPIDRSPTEAPAEPSQPPEARVTLELPVDVIAAINQRLGQAGQTQTEVILEVLRSALAGNPQPSDGSKPPDLQPSDLQPSDLQPPDRNLNQTGSPIAETTVVDPIQELQALKRRLIQLEQLIPKMEELEGKLQAF